MPIDFFGGTEEDPAAAFRRGFGSDPVGGFGGILPRIKSAIGATNQAIQGAPLTTGPQQLGGEFQRIANEGLFSEADIQDIFGQTRKSLGADRRAQARGLRRNLGRRLGSRSGAVETLVANQSGRTRAALGQMMAQLRSRNVESRQVGLQGLFQVLQFLENRKQQQLNREAAEGGGSGFLDIVGGIAPIVGGLFGGPAGAGAGEAARGVFK